MGHFLAKNDVFDFFRAEKRLKTAFLGRFSDRDLGPEKKGSLAYL